MRYLYSAIMGTIYIMFCSCTQNATDKIWGVWNFGDKKDAVFNGQISLGYYARTNDFLQFDPHFKPNNKAIDEQLIEGEGFYYIIKKIIQKNAYYLNVDYPTKDETADGHWKDVVKPGAILMHFIDNDHMWLEYDFEHPNNPQFKTGIFLNEKKIYWRAQKLTKPLADDVE
jgi:hypothetical protein